MSNVRLERRRWIERLLAEGGVGSQHDLLERLRASGVSTTQATLSRDLADLGVVKGPEGWRMPGEAETAPSDLGPAIRAYMLHVHVGGTMVVLRTRTGHATPLAVELDRTRMEGSLGTVAGDDTIFLACKSPAAARSVARRMESMLRGDRIRRPVRR